MVTTGINNQQRGTEAWQLDLPCTARGSINGNSHFVSHLATSTKSWLGATQLPFQGVFWKTERQVVLKKPRLTEQPRLTSHTQTPTWVSRSQKLLLLGRKKYSKSTGPHKARLAYVIQFNNTNTGRILPFRNKMLKRKTGAFEKDKIFQLFFPLQKC